MTYSLLKFALMSPSVAVAPLLVTFFPASLYFASIIYLKNTRTPLASQSLKIYDISVILGWIAAYKQFLCFFCWQKLVCIRSSYDLYIGIVNMDETGETVDLHGNTKLTPILSPGSDSKNSPSFRRFHSTKTPRRNPRSGSTGLQWIRSHRIVFWLILITLWAYIGFHVQSTWAHGDHRKTDFMGYKSEAVSVKIQENTEKASDSLVFGTITSAVKEPDLGEEKISDSDVPAKEKPTSTKTSNGKRGRRRMLRKVKLKESVVESTDSEFEDVEIPKGNSSFGLMVGPFNEIEDRIVGLRSQKRKGKCDREREFARLVWTRYFVLIFHELSMTGAPLSMLELATEILRCGGNVKVVALCKKGGLTWELARRGIEIIEDKGDLSFKAAMKADLVIAGSAVSTSWIEQYLRRNPAGSSQLVWWIMENRQEYFNRSKHMLSKVNMLAFLSDIQSKQWLSWCEEAKIRLKTQPMLVPLAVNDDLAFVAGLPSSLNTPLFTAKKMIEKRYLLRDEVRKSMGLSDKDMLVMTLSSINPAKGQLLLLEAAHLVAERNVTHRYPTLLKKEMSALSHEDELQAAALHLNTSKTEMQVNFIKKKKRKRSRLTYNLSSNSQTKAVVQNQPQVRNLLSESAVSEEENLKLLIGSIGSKSNKAPYVKAMLRFVSQNSNMSKLVFWTQATTSVASLYAAADVYVLNAQGVGETFGRVTIEAMAFGLPVLGTNAGGTREIVEDNVTGLLHPPGHEGREALAQNILHLLKNPADRKKMGTRGRQKVQESYLKQRTYSEMARVLAKFMKARL